VPAEIGNPDIDDGLGDTKGLGDIVARPTLNDDALDYLAAPGNRNRTIA
jgi:hypothetical protein